MGFERAVVHIGLHKTGTTALQHALFTNRDRLRREHAVLYPDIGANHSVWLYSLFGSSPHTYPPNVKQGMSTPASAAARNEERARRLEELLDQSGAHSLLLSGEDLSLLTGPEVAEFGSWIRRHCRSVRVAVMLREPVSWFTSLAQHAVKQHLTLEEAHRHVLETRGVRDRVAPWVEEFGAGAVVAGDVSESAAHSRGIVGAFCALAGLPEAVAGPPGPVTRQNEALSQAGARLMSELNRIRPFYEDGQMSTLRRTDDFRAFERVGGPPFRLPDDVHAAVVERAATERDWVEMTLGIVHGRVGGDPAEEDGAPDEPWEAVALAISDLHNQLSDLRQRHARANDRIRRLQARIGGLRQRGAKPT